MAFPAKWHKIVDSTAFDSRLICSFVRYIASFISCCTFVRVSTNDTITRSFWLTSLLFSRIIYVHLVVLNGFHERFMVLWLRKCIHWNQSWIKKLSISYPLKIIRLLFYWMVLSHAHLCFNLIAKVKIWLDDPLCSNEIAPLSDIAASDLLLKYMSSERFQKRSWMKYCEGAWQGSNAFGIRMGRKKSHNE